MWYYYLDWTLFGPLYPASIYFLSAMTALLVWSSFKNMRKFVSTMGSFEKTLDKVATELAKINSDSKELQTGISQLRENITKNSESIDRNHSILQKVFWWVK